MKDSRDAVAAATVAASALLVAWIGLDAWILAVWGISIVVLVVLVILGRLLARELGAARGRPRRSHVGAWIAGGIAAFVSCTMAAALVRSGAPVRDFWLLGLLMLLAIVDLRLAYLGPRAR